MKACGSLGHVSWIIAITACWSQTRTNHNKSRKLNHQETVHCCCCSWLFILISAPAHISITLVALWTPCDETMEARRETEDLANCLSSVGRSFLCLPMSSENQCWAPSQQVALTCFPCFSFFPHEDHLDCGFKWTPGDVWQHLQMKLQKADNRNVVFYVSSCKT